MIKQTYTFEVNGEKNAVYTISNSKGCEVDVLTYGARITRIWMPDRNGTFGDLIVGCKNPEDYYGPSGYYGATIGRYGNRIGGSQFTLNGVTYKLEANNGKNNLHGGKTANFDRKVWDANIVGENLEMTLHSPDMAGGFPGNMDVKVVFSLSEDNALRIEYFAKSDKDTVCNLTNHSYFNLGGQDTILGHELMIKSRQITPVDDELIPHGDFLDIDGTPFSFYAGKLLGTDMFSKEHIFAYCNGYDFNYCLERASEHDLEHFAYVYDKESGRRMDCYTTLPGVQLYTACGTGGFKGKKDYVNHCSLCLETQGYPNSPNCPTYPSTVLKAGELYNEVTVYKFSIK